MDAQYSNIKIRIYFLNETLIGVNNILTNDVKI